MDQFWDHNWLIEWQNKYHLHEHWFEKNGDLKVSIKKTETMLNIFVRKHLILAKMGHHFWIGLNDEWQSSELNIFEQPWKEWERLEMRNPMVINFKVRKGVE